MKRTIAMKTDFTYTESGFWVSFFPENPQAVTAWNEFAQANAENGATLDRILCTNKDFVCKLLRSYGYSVRKAKAKKHSQESDDKLLDSLGILTNINY